MKTKNFLLIVLFICSIGASNSLFAGSVDKNLPPLTANRSLAIPSISIVVTEGTGVEAFFRPVGMVKVIVRDKATATIVYHKLVDTERKSNLYINTSSLPAGVYTILFLDMKGSKIIESGIVVD